MNRICVSAMALVALAGAATTASAAVTIQFRMIERSAHPLVSGVPQIANVVSPANAGPQVDIRVQARVFGSDLTPNSGIGSFNFNIILPGEKDRLDSEPLNHFDPLANGGLGATVGDPATNPWGALSKRATTTKGVFSYALNTGANNSGGGWGTNQSTHHVGLAGQYTYLSGVNANFGGVLNESGGSFTDSRNQEIGVVTGSANGAALLLPPGMDPNGEGNPSTWVGYGANQVAPNGQTAIVPNNFDESGIGDGPFINTAATYFGNAGTTTPAAGAGWIDVFHFRYTVTNFTERDIQFTFNDLGASYFDSLLKASGDWSAVQGPITPTISGTGITVHVVPSPASAALMGLGGLMIARRRRS